VCGGLQHPLTASDDCQEGDAFLAAALFAPAPSRSPIAELVSHTAQTRRQRIQRAGTTTGRFLKTNRSGPTKEVAFLQRPYLRLYQIAGLFPN
jgi:hypothetical protein